MEQKAAPRKIWPWIAVINWLLFGVMIVSFLAGLLAYHFQSLIVIGFLFLILPGLFLMYSPTIFVWSGLLGIILSITRRSAPPFAALVIAFVATGALLWALAQPNYRGATKAYNALTLPKVIPDGPLRLRGNVRLEVPPSTYDRIGKPQSLSDFVRCDALCVALLFLPGVSSVTVNPIAYLQYDDMRSGKSRLNPVARTYRLTPKTANCKRTEIDYAFAQNPGAVAATLNISEAQILDWKARLENDRCVIIENSSPTHDIVIRYGLWEAKSEPDQLRFGGDLAHYEIYGDFAQVVDANGAALLQQFDLELNMPAVPLTLVLGDPKWDGNDADRHKASLEPAYHRYPQGYVSYNEKAPQKALFKALHWEGDATPAEAITRTRAALLSALADPSLPANASAFAGVDAYVSLLEKHGASDADYQVIKDLIADPRFDDYPYSYRLTKIFSDEQLRALLPIIIRKLANPPVNAITQNVAQSTGQLGWSLRSYPEGSFAKLTPAARALMQDPDKRRRAAGIVARLSDGGATYAPLLADMIDYHARNKANIIDQRKRERERKFPSLTPNPKASHHPSEPSTTMTPKATAVPPPNTYVKDRRINDQMAGDDDIINAAIYSLCTIGDPAAAVLPELIKIQSLIDRRGQDGTRWNTMLLRLGYPIGQIEVPAGIQNDVQSYHDSLQRQITDPRNHDYGRICPR